MPRLILLCIFFIPTLSFASPAADALSQRLANMKALQAEFSQTIVDDSGKPMQTSSGIFWLEQPGFFRWETKKPFQQQLLTKGNDLWIYDVDLEQVVVQPVNKAVGSTPALILSGAVQNLDEHYQVQQKADKKYTSFLLKPKVADGATFSELTLRFSGNQLASLAFADALGQRVEISLHKVQSPARLDPKLYSLSFPKGTDVIYQ